MNKILLSLGLLVATTVNAQYYEGNWETYSRFYNNIQSSIVVDLDYGNAAIASQKPNFILVSVKLKTLQQDRMPGFSELGALDTLENVLVQTLQEAVQAIYTGRNTLNGKRDFYFYTNDTSTARNNITDVVKQAGYAANILIKPDKELENYHYVLYPTDMEKERIMNKRMVETMLEKGDVLKAPRKVVHTLLFKEEKQRKTFVDTIREIGFEPENAGKELQNGDYPYSLQISRNDSIELDHIDEVTLDIWELALKFNGRYEGWETFVVKQIVP